MEQVTTPPVLQEPTDKRTPWGTIIGIILILAIVVFAAYYALSTRIAVSATSSVASSR